IPKSSLIRANLSALLSATHSHLLFSDLGCKLFSTGNVQDTHRDFEKEHQCNDFCTFFKVPTTYDQSSDTSPDSGSKQQEKRHVSRLYDLLNPATSSIDDLD
ncbi:hypothetical protein V8E53_011928, partial [Lactarius tabidus]